MTRTRATIFLQGCKIKDQVASLKKLVACAIRYVTYLKTFRPSVPHSSGTELAEEMDSHVKGNGMLYVQLRGLHLVALRGKKVLGHTQIGSL